jgi:hypothetical protein
VTFRWEGLVLKQLRLVIGFAVASCLLASTVQAGAVAPGETKDGTFEGNNLTPLPPDAQWKGELLGERTDPWSFIGEQQPNGERPTASGTFASRVYRDTGTGGLAFVYQLSQTRQTGVLDLEHVNIRSFAGFSTDAYFTDNDHRVTRSADGATLDYIFNFEGLNGTFLVRTDATAFNAGGSFTVDGTFEPSEGSDGATFAAFQPAADTGPGPSPVPLPPAAWAGLVTVGDFGTGAGARRWLRALA